MEGVQKKRIFYRKSCVEVGVWDRLLKIKSIFFTPPLGDIGFFGKEGRVEGLHQRLYKGSLQFAVLRILTQFFLTGNIPANEEFVYDL